MKVVLLAGGFGTKIDIKKAAGIGLIPKELEMKTIPAGNTVLAGTKEVLLGKISKEELEEALEGKSKECREIQEEIGKELSRILKNVEYLAERGTFSFDRLNTRLGKNIGGTINEMLEAKIKELGENNKFGSKTFYQSTLSLIKRYKKNDVPIRDITAVWLRDFE